MSMSAEMTPWSVGGHYDRPIARRIIEEAGVERGQFANRKFGGCARIYSPATAYTLGDVPWMQADMGEFMTDAGAESFVAFAEGRAERHRTKMKLVTWGYWFYQKLEAVNWRVGKRLHPVGIQGLIPRRVMSMLASRLIVRGDYTYLFPHWGTALLKPRYEPAVQASRDPDE